MSVSTHGHTESSHAPPSLLATVQLWRLDKPVAIFPSIQAAAAAAADGDRLLLSPGCHAGPLRLNRNVQLIGCVAQGADGVQRAASLVQCSGDNCLLIASVVSMKDVAISLLCDSNIDDDDDDGRSDNACPSCDELSHPSSGDQVAADTKKENSNQDLVATAAGGAELDACAVTDKCTVELLHGSSGSCSCHAAAAAEDDGICRDITAAVVVHRRGQLHMANCIITAADHAGIICHGAGALVRGTHCIIERIGRSGCEAENGGVVELQHSVLQDCEQHCVSAGHGGLVSCQDCSFYNFGYSAVACSRSSQVQVSGCDFFCGRDGVYVQDEGSSVTMLHCNIHQLTGSVLVAWGEGAEAVAIACNVMQVDAPPRALTSSDAIMTKEGGRAIVHESDADAKGQFTK